MADNWGPVNQTVQTEKDYKGLLREIGGTKISTP
jgi:hypothetical protein